MDNGPFRPLGPLCRLGPFVHSIGVDDGLQFFYFTRFHPHLHPSR